jgi:protein-disulfide isomerase
MKVGTLLACSMAALALAACNKNKNQEAGTPAGNDTIQVTQATPPPGGTWADVVNASSSGGFVMGNPNAKVKLLEIGSLSCPHCKAFDDEGVPALIENYVKPGKVSWEFRTYVIHGPIDVAADILVRCNGGKTFFPLARALYKDQTVWLGKIEAVPQDKLAAVQNLPTNQVFVNIASLGGLQDWAAARGVPQAKSNQCLGNQQMINQQVQMTADVNTEFPDFTGTPAFAINGKLLKDTAGWDKLKPQLDEAVK